MGALEAGAAERTICDDHNLQLLPGDVVRVKREPPTGDEAVDEAYDGLGATVELFYNAFSGTLLTVMVVTPTVHYDRDYSNVFWDGTQMVFGDGDREIFNRFTITVDVIGHVTWATSPTESGLIYWTTWRC